jgi:hypothetical protein
MTLRDALANALKTQIRKAFVDEFIVNVNYKVVLCTAAHSDINSKVAAHASNVSGRCRGHDCAW